MGSSLEKLKVLHFADCHLRDDDKFAERQACLEHIVKMAQELEPDIIVCAGDVFDSRHVRLESLSAKLAFRVFSDLCDVAPVVTVAGTPSHEGSTMDVFSHVHGRHPIHVASRPDQKIIENDRGPIAVVTSIPAFTKQYLGSSEDITNTDNMAAGMVGQLLAGFGTKTEQVDLPHIIIGHGQVKGAMVSETQELIGVDIEIPKDAFALAYPTVVCMGHIHKAQKIPGSNIWYSGSTQSENWGELDDKGFILHTLCEPIGGNGIWTHGEAKFYDTPSIKRVRFAFDFTSDEGNLGEMEDQIYASSVSIGDLEGAKVRLEAKVFVDESEMLDSDMIRDFFIKAGAISCDIVRIRVPRVNIRSSRLVELEALRDRIKERARLIGDAIDPDILDKADLLERDPQGITDALQFDLEGGDQQ